jgi:hypothetical protein
MRKSVTHENIQASAATSDIREDATLKAGQSRPKQLSSAILSPHAPSAISKALDESIQTCLHPFNVMWREENKAKVSYGFS